MSKVFIEESTLTSIGDAIRSKEGSAELIPPLEMPARIEALSNGGIPTEWISQLKLTSLNVFGKEEAEITLPNAYEISGLAAPAITSLAEAEGKVNTTVKHLTINAPTTSQAANVVSTTNFGPDYTLEHLTLNVDLSRALSFSYFIRNCRALRIIDGTPIDFSAATNLTGALSYLPELRELRFQGSIKADLSISSSKLLSKSSIQSLLPCLSGTVSGKTLTLSLQAVDAAFETAEGAADGSSSAEWTALVDSKPNWTISLV